MTAPASPFTPPRPSRWRLRRWWGRHPRWMRAGVLVLLAVGVGAGGYYWYVKRARGEQRQQVATQWQAFDKAARALDDAGMRAALDELLALRPDEPVALRRRQALDTGDADPSDAAMCALTVLRHARANRWADAEREADKRLVYAADDWVCRCAKVAAALGRGDRAAAGRLLDALPDPASETAGMNADGALFAVQLFRAAGRDPAPVRNFLRGVIVHRLRSLDADHDPPVVTAKLLECYLVAFHPTDPNPGTLALAVAPIDRLLDTATKAAAEANDVPVLVRLGQVCERLFAAFDLLHRDKAMTDKQYEAVRAEHQSRTRAVWQAVRARAATEPAAYRGLALAHVRDRDATKATEAVLEGLAVAPADPGLLSLLTVLFQQDNRAADALATVGRAADREPTNAPLQLLAAEAAAAAGRNDLVLLWCRRAYAVQPKHPAAARLEARAYLLAGDAHKALQVLSEMVGEDRLVDDPIATRWYVRSKVEALPVGLEPFLAKCEAAAVARQNPDLIAAALAGVADATFNAEATATAERLAGRWLDARPDSPDVMRVRALLLARTAQFVAPAWDVTRLRPATDAYAELSRKLPDDLGVAAERAWLLLKGERNVPAAVRAVEPLTAAAARRDPLTARQFEVLGAVLLADGQTEAAVRALETAARVPVPTPTTRIHLALAYGKWGRAADARAALDTAARDRTSWSAQDDADYRLAVETIQRENR